MHGEKKIAVISEDLAEPWDEGIKKYTFSVAEALRSEMPVLLLNVDRSGVDGKAAERVGGSRTFLSSELRGRLRAFDPDFVLYVPSPSSTQASFFRAAALRRHVPRAKSAMVAMIPRKHGRIWRPYLRLTAPDLIFVPSYATLLYFERMGLRGEAVPPGVDPECFRPPRGEERAELRARHGIDEGTFLYLHVGHISRKRNLLALGALAEQPGAGVIVIGSTSTPEDASLRSELEAIGIRVIREYVKVEEYLRMADCYVFPVEDTEGCIEFPLGVLEALASGLPVLATPFGGLRDFLPEGPDLLYWSDRGELRERSEAIRKSPRPEIRDLEDFTWKSVASRLLEKLEDEDAS
jgi:glycosyltransferase involved in cell wall biosynthesis